MEMNSPIFTTTHPQTYQEFTEMSYVYANNDFQGGTLLNISNFKTIPICLF